MLLAQHGEEYAEMMDPVGFMWPPDREWGAAQGNHASCDSASGATNRTEFPLRTSTHTFQHLGWLDLVKRPNCVSRPT